MCSSLAGPGGNGRLGAFRSTRSLFLNPLTVAVRENKKDQGTGG